MTDIPVPEDVRKLAREAVRKLSGECDDAKDAEVIAAAILADREKRGEPVAWVIPGDDNARDNGFLDAMAWQEGEFSKPLYAAPPAPAQPGGDQAA